MTIEAIQAALQDRRIDKVARATGLHYNTVRDIRDSTRANPTLRVMTALSNYIEEGSKQ